MVQASIARQFQSRNPHLIFSLTFGTNPTLFWGPGTEWWKQRHNLLIPQHLGKILFIKT
jgi:hypothetical protein